MDNMEKVNRSREEERAALLEEKLHQDNALQEVDAIWADLKAELEAKQISLETRQDEARSVWMSWLRCVPKLAPLCRVPSLTAMSSSAASVPSRDRTRDCRGLFRLPDHDPRRRSLNCREAIRSSIAPTVSA